MKNLVKNRGAYYTWARIIHGEIRYFTSLFFFSVSEYEILERLSGDVEEILIPICIAKQEKRRLNKLITNQSEL